MSKYLTFVRLLLGVLYCLFVFLPFLNLWLHGLPEEFKGIDPEIINGLLAGSAILFGFATLPSIKKKIDWLMAFFILGDLGLLAMSGAEIFLFGLGKDTDGLRPLLFVTAALMANAITALYRHVLSLE